MISGNLGFAISEESHVQMAIYFNESEDLRTALEIWRGLKPT